MANKREIYKDDITKLIDGKSLDEIIENLQNLRNSCYGCEVIKIKLTTNYRPMVAMYDVVTEIPSNFDLRNPKLKPKTLVRGKMNDNTGKTLPCRVEVTKESFVEKYETIDVPFPIFNLTELPRNLFMDTNYFKEVYNKDVDGLEEITIINKLKTIFKNSRNRLFIRYGKGKHDICYDGSIAGFFILNLDTIITPTIEILVPNKEQVKFLIGKDGNTAKEFVNEINKEFGFNKVKKIFFKEVL